MKTPLNSFYAGKMLQALGIGIGLGLLTVPAISAEVSDNQVTPKPVVQIVVEKKSPTKAPKDSLLYKTGSDKILVSSGAQGNKQEAAQAAKAKLDMANGNVYALAINSNGVPRATGVVHVNGRTLLVADPEGYLAKLARKQSSSPTAPVVASNAQPNP